MPITIKIKFSNTAAAVPTLVDGEVAVNQADRLFYYRDNGGVVRSKTLNSEAATATTHGALIAAATEKTTPVDADMVSLMDSAASNVLKKLSWANVKATLKTYFDTLYGPKAHSKGITLVSPTATENMVMFYTDVAITITRAAEAVKGTSPSVTYNIRFGTDRSAVGTALFASDRAVTSLTGTTTTTFANASIPAGSWVRIVTSAVSGTIDDFHVTLIYQ